MTDSQTEVPSVEQAGGDVEDKNAPQQEVKDEAAISEVEDVGQDETKRAATETENVPTDVDKESGSELLPSSRSLETLSQATEGGVDEDAARGGDGEEQRDQDNGKREHGANGEEIGLEVEAVEEGKGDKEVKDTGNDTDITSGTREVGDSVNEEAEEGASETTNKTDLEGTVVGEEKADEGQAMEESKVEGAEEMEGSVGQETCESSMAPIEEDEEVDEGQPEPDDPSEQDDPSEPAHFVLRRCPEEDEFSLEPEFDENNLLFKNDDYDSQLSVVTQVSVARKSLKSTDGVEEGDDDDDEVRELPSVERDKNYELCRIQHTERTALRRRNCVLQRKMMLHLKKRRANKEVFQQEAATPAQETHYSKKLSQFEEAQIADADARRLAAEDVDLLEATIARRSVELSDLLDALIDHERDTCVLMVSQKTGKPLPERVIERLLLRQRDAVDEVGDARRAQIRAMKRASDVEDSIRGLEDLGENVKLLDYEQLRIENQNLADKVEERDEELARFRARAVHTKSALSHFRQKSVGVHEAIQRQTEKLKTGLEDLDAARSELNSLKATRDKLRADFVRESAQSGLLTKPQLLRDFEHTLDECAAQRVQMQQLQEEIAQQQLQLEAVRALAPVFQKATSLAPRSRISPLLARVKLRAQPTSCARQSRESDELFAFL